MLTRREVVKGISVAGLSTGLGASFQTGLALAKNRRIELPTWAYGKNSFADDAMLMFRGNPTHTFYGTGPVPDMKPEIKWRFKTAVINNVIRGNPTTWAGTGWTGTAVKLGDYVFFGSPGGYVYALDAATGALQWKHKGGGMFKGSACLYENRLYIGNTDNLLRCLDAETGRKIWTVDTSRDLDSSPCVVDDRLYIAGENGNLRCLVPQTGKQIWKRFVDGIGPGTLLGSNGSETSPAVADGQVFTATYDGILFCVDADTGKVLWNANTGDDTDSSPVIYGDHVFVCAEENAPYMYCFDRKDGREVWRYGENAGAFYSTPAIAHDLIWVGAEDQNLHCVDAKTGEGVWKFKTGGGVWSSPCVVGGKVVFGSRDGHVYCLGAGTGTEFWRVKLDGRIISSPCIIDGKIWVGTATGYFYSLSA